MSRKQAENLPDFQEKSVLPTCASQGLASWQPARGTAGKMLNPGSGPAGSCCQELIHSCWLLTQPLHCLTGFPSIFSGFPSILTYFLSILSCFLSTLSHKPHHLHSDQSTNLPALHLISHSSIIYQSTACKETLPQRLQELGGEDG